MYIYKIFTYQYLTLFLCIFSIYRLFISHSNFLVAEKYKYYIFRHANYERLLIFYPLKDGGGFHGIL